MAARERAPRSEGSLLIVGAGAQGRSHLEAFREGLGVREAYVFSRTHESAEALAAHAEGLGIGATIVEGPGAAPAEVSLVVTATTSREPVLPEAVTEGTFVAAVGSLEPGAAELPPGLISGATVVVDTMEGAEEEAGDLIQAERVGAFQWSGATELGRSLAAGTTRRARSSLRALATLCGTWRRRGRPSPADRADVGPRVPPLCQKASRV